MEELVDPMSRTNDLGRDEISCLVIRLAIPTMLAQLVNDDSELISLYYGEEVSEEDLKEEKETADIPKKTTIKKQPKKEKAVR